MERLNEEKMLHKFLKAQQNNPVKNDWILQVIKDKEELQIDISDKELLKMSKNVYKKYIRKKIKNATLRYLNMLKGKHNKMKNVNSKNLKCSEYLTNSKFTKLEAQMLFKFRTRMFNVKENFENLYQDMRCDLCHIENCSQSHLFQCPIIKSFVPEIDEKKIKYEYIFGNINEMKKVAQILEKISQIRDELLEDLKCKI